MDILHSNGEVKNPGLVKRKRVFADLDYTNSMTKQSFKDECDVNKIMARYTKTHDISLLMQRNPRFGDFSDVPSYQEALHRVIFAQEQFEALNAVTRARFNNDPAQFLAFASDPENNAEMVKLGLAKEVLPTPEPSPQKVIVVNPDVSGDDDPSPPKGKVSKSTK